MSSWRDQILNEFTPKAARLTLVADPDGLLLEEGILEGIRERGFDLIPFEDHIAFRYAYESKFRSRWDRGEKTDLVVVLRSQASDLGFLPYDLLRAGRRLSFSLGDVFPNLSYPVVTALDRGDLNTLYEAQNRHAPGQLGNNATKEFILRHVFEIAPELIKQPSDMLRVLLRRHYRGQRIPTILDERLIQLLRLNNTFDGWPLEILLQDRESFFTFLQERWPIFLDREAVKGISGIQEAGELYGLAIKGPVDLPFDHHDIRVYIDNLFIEGLLRSVPHEHAEALSKTWLSIGVRTDPDEDRLHRMTKLIESMQASIPSEGAKHTDWFHFARGWAELILLVNEQTGTIPVKTSERIKSLQAQVDNGFTDWLLKRSAGLDLLKRLPRRDRIAVHWGMVMATYPFWAVVASQVGRLLRLQGSATAMHVQRRIREQYGERETVSRRTRYVLRSYVDWGVLCESSTKGVYKAGSSLTVKDSRLIAWMVEASLHTRTNGCAPPGDLFDSPGFFPFHLKRISALSILAASANLDMLRHGLNNDLVMLKKR
jgi:hypothetical protein